jgi:signal transduction histidine kinase
MSVEAYHALPAEATYRGVNINTNRHVSIFPGLSLFSSATQNRKNKHIHRIRQTTLDPNPPITPPAFSQKREKKYAVSGTKSPNPVVVVVAIAQYTESIRVILSSPSPPCVLLRREKREEKKKEKKKEKRKKKKEKRKKKKEKKEKKRIGREIENLNRTKRHPEQNQTENEDRKKHRTFLDRL